jgi:Na+-driven multidrug efflux pump
MSSFNSFNDSVLISGNGAASNIEGFVYVIMNSLHQTAVNYIGQNVGAGKFDRVKKAYWICMICVLVAGMTAGGLVYAFGEPLLSIYITDSQLAIEYGLRRFSIVCVTYFLCGLMDVSTGALRGLGSSFIPMLISVLGVCGLRILWIYTIFRIPRFHTPESLYLSYPVSWLITVAAQVTAFLIIYKKKSRQYHAESV